MSEAKDHIGKLERAEDFLRDNEYIHSGYRINFNSNKKIVRSLFMVHNESVNVWSHLIGVGLFMVLIWHAAIFLGLNTNPNYLDMASLQTNLSNTYESGLSKIEDLGHDIQSVYSGIANWEKFKEIGDDIQQGYSQVKQTAVKFLDFCDDHLHLQSNFTIFTQINQGIDQISLSLTNMCGNLKNMLDQQQYDWIYPVQKQQNVARWPLFVFMLSAIVCLGCSATYHLFNAKSEFVYKFMSRVDYTGTSFLIAGSFYPLIYYQFFCYELYIYIYLTCITVGCTSIFIMAMTPRFQDPDMRTFRGLTFLAVGLFGIVPVVHMVFLPEFAQFAQSLFFCIMMGLSYTLGVIVYVSRVPERFYPGCFDIWGNSHQIWHFFVVAAAVFHYISSINSYYVRLNLQCSA